MTCGQNNAAVRRFGGPTSRRSDASDDGGIVRINSDLQGMVAGGDFVGAEGSPAEGSPANLFARVGGLTDVGRPADF
jgi:hypothetical protein